MTEYFTLPKNNESNTSMSLNIALEMLANRGERVSRCCVCDYIVDDDYASDWGSCTICEEKICVECVDKNDTEDSGLPLSCYECYLRNYQKEEKIYTCEIIHK